MVVRDGEKRSLHNALAAVATASLRERGVVCGA